MKSMEVGQTVLGWLRTSGVAEEEGSFRVLDGFGCSFCERSFAAGITGFAGRLC